MQNPSLNWLQSTLTSVAEKVLETAADDKPLPDDAPTQTPAARAVVTALAAALLLVSLLIVYCIYRKPQPDAKATFFAIFEDRIRGGFPEQSAEAMSTLLTGVNSVLRPCPVSPCVLLLVATPSAREAAVRLARALAAAVQAALVRWPSDEVEVDSSRFSGPEDFWHLLESLGQRLSEQRVVILSNIQALHPHSAAALAHLSDDTFAPYPQAVLVLTLGVAERWGSAADADAVALAETCLSQCWREQADLPMPDLLGRITGRAVLVRHH